MPFDYQALEREKQAREEAEKRAAQEALLRQATERKARIYTWIASLALSLTLIVAFELFIHVAPWGWFQQHSGKPGLQIAIDTLLVFATMGFFHPHLRNLLWGAGVLALLGTVFQLL